MLMETDHEDEDRGDPSPLLKAAKRIWMRKRSKWKKSGTQLKVAALLVEMDFPNELEYPTTDLIFSYSDATGLTLLGGPCGTGTPATSEASVPLAM